MSAAALKLVTRFRQRELGRAPVRQILEATDAVKSNAHPRVPNPFLFQRDPKSGRWLEPRYSRRRQAELVKAARASGTLHLLPPGPKLHRSEIAEFRRKQEDQRLAALQEAESSKKTKKKAKSKKAAKILESTEAQPNDAPHERPVHWTGRVWDRRAKGYDRGARLYARKKFMFKGHRWEKVVVLRNKFIKLRLKSQARRIRRWHATRIVRRNPFNPVRGTARLPF
ncbi:hypothetical protein AURDEDRAFT_111898 [Auricularia subglabra TFB-10046 SS5]|nr:hypothetical protein AURDEDRAFT_111898 [Auricularia subglabra TFB-10046 SS5]